MESEELLNNLSLPEIQELMNRYFSERKIANLRACLNFLLSRNPRNVELRFQEAWLFLFQDDISRYEAITYCRDAILRMLEEFPEIRADFKNYPLIYIRLAECFNEVGPKSSALYIYQELLKFLKDPYLIYRYVVILADIGRPYIEILPFLEEALKRDPKKHLIRNDLIKSLHAKNTITAKEIKELECLQNHDGIYGNTEEGITVLKFSDNPHLGGNALEGDPASYAPATWEYLINRFCISSVLDLGSGTGHAAEFFFRKKLKVIAVEGSLYNCVNSVYPSICHDLTKGPVKCSVDLVHCVELVEHVEERYLQNIIDSFLCGKYIAITAAQIGQGGHHHVNEQPNEYWINHLKNAGCDLLESDTSRLRRLAEKDGCAWFAKNGMVFVNRARQK